MRERHSLRGALRWPPCFGFPPHVLLAVACCGIWSSFILDSVHLNTWPGGHRMPQGEATTWPHGPLQRTFLLPCDFAMAHGIQRPEHVQDHGVGE